MFFKIGNTRGKENLIPSVPQLSHIMDHLEFLAIAGSACLQAVGGRGVKSVGWACHLTAPPCCHKIFKVRIYSDFTCIPGEKLVMGYSFTQQWKKTVTHWYPFSREIFTFVELPRDI